MYRHAGIYRGCWRGSRTFSFNRASLMGRVVRGMGATVLGDSSAIAVAVWVRETIDGSDAVLDVVLVVGCGRRWMLTSSCRSLQVPRSSLAMTASLGGCGCPEPGSASSQLFLTFTKAIALVQRRDLIDVVTWRPHFL